MGDRYLKRLHSHKSSVFKLKALREKNLGKERINTSGYIHMSSWWWEELQCSQPSLQGKYHVDLHKAELQKSIPNSPVIQRLQAGCLCVEKEWAPLPEVADVFSAKTHEMAGSLGKHLETESYAMRREDTQTTIPEHVGELYSPSCMKYQPGLRRLKLNWSIWLEFCPDPLTKGGGGGGKASSRN